jgi:hypothetical protein
MRGLARVPVAGQLGNIGRFKKIRFYMIANISPDLQVESVPQK